MTNIQKYMGETIFRSVVRRRSTMKSTDNPPSDMAIRKKKAQLIQDETSETGLVGVPGQGDSAKLC